MIDTTSLDSRRLGVVALTAVLLVALLLAPLGTTVATAQTANNSTATPVDVGDDAPDESNDTETSSTATTNASNSDGPTTATSVRISPVPYDEDFMSVETAIQDERYNTTGGYVVFSTSEPVSAARVEESPATAQVMDGEHTIYVDYSDNASSGTNVSLYTLTLFFEDGSQHEVELYASRTDISTAPANVRRSQEFIRQMREDAAAHGFQENLDGIIAYHQWEKEQADLFENIWSEQIARTFSAGLIILRTPLALSGVFVTAILVAYWMLKRHGWKLKEYINNDNLVRQKRQRLNESYRRDQQAAAEHKLREVDAIGSQAHFWGEVYDVYSVKQLADLAAFGLPDTDENGTARRDEEGELVYSHHGVDDLNSENVYGDAWLQAVCKPKMMDPVTALTHMKRSLELMETQYGQPQRYREARERTAHIIERIESGDGMAASRGAQSTAGFGGAAGGDD